MSLATVPMLAALPQLYRDRLARWATELAPPDGTQVFTQLDPADAIFAIVGGDGHVRARSVDYQGKSLMVEVFRPGDIFGEVGVIDGDYRTATAVVHGRVRLIRIPAAIFLEVLSQCPELGLGLTRLLTNRLRRTYSLLQDASFETLEVRLARQVLYLAEREGRQTEQGLRVAIRLRQGDLADLLGTTSRSIITILNSWRATGLVAYDTERAFLTLRDQAALRALIG